METPKSITGIVRGCGKRKPGGLYVCSGLSPYGRPIEEYIIDPPLPYNGEPFRAPTIIERDGKKHLVLWVGSEYYPYASDYLEETKQFGVSKRVPSNFPVEGLEPGSMLFLVHPRAIIEDHSFLPAPDYCPKHNTAHLEDVEGKDREFCLGHSYSIAEPTVGLNQRTLGDTTYTVYSQGMSEVSHDFKAGFFLRVPITHFDHVMTGDGKVNPAIMEKQTRLPVNIEKE